MPTAHTHTHTQNKTVLIKNAGLQNTKFLLKNGLVFRLIKKKKQKLISSSSHLPRPSFAFFIN